MTDITPKFYASIQNGIIEISPIEKELIEKYCMQFKEGQELEITIKKKYKKRTQGAPGEDTNFNGYWWAVIVRMVADEIGEENQDYVHHSILMQIGHFVVDKFGNKQARETKTLSGAEFSDLCSRARIWASNDLNLYIPEPREAEWQR